jgi:hypothetical protein
MSLFSQEIVLDGHITSAEAREKWADEVESGARKAKVKGKSLYLHSYEKTSKLLKKCVLYYYRDYGRDFCDSMFTGEIFEYEDGGCQITGVVTVPKAMKRFAIALIALSLPLARLFNEILFAVSPLLNINFYTLDRTTFEVMTFIIVALTFITIGFMCMVVDKNKVNGIIEYLHGFLRDENQQKQESKERKRL